MENMTEKKKRGRKKGSTNKKIKENIVENIVDNVPKKRGRKPKDNIIKNDNPVFKNTDDSDNLIVRLKNNVNIKSNIISYENTENYKEINNCDNSECNICWNCCHKMKNPLGLPLKYDNEIFYIYGYFCSLECASRYAFDNLNNHFEVYTLINFYYNKINKTIGEKVNIAPKKTTLKIFGGNLSIEEYRSCFKNECIHYVNIPPIYPINHQINTYEKQLNNNYLKNDLKLYRKNKIQSETNILNTF